MTNANKSIGKERSIKISKANLQVFMWMMRQRKQKDLISKCHFWYAEAIKQSTISNIKTKKYR